MPASYHTCRSEVSALFAGLLTKVGVYAMLRYFSLVDPSVLDWAKEPLIWLAVLSMVVGVLGAASSYHIKRILAFHSVSQIGYIFLGVVLATTFSFAAALFYTVHHMMVKSGLFLVGGVVEKMKGTVDLKSHGGLLKKSPLLAILFLVLALSLAGLPVFSGFFAKFTLVRSSFLAEQFWAGGMALAVGFFTLYSMIKIWLEGFWKDQPAVMVTEGKTEFFILVPVACLALASLVFGLMPNWVYQFCELAAAQILEPGIYREKVLSVAKAAGFLL
jgi:multicomponent Na+:H+ antiporter subunit D